MKKLLPVLLLTGCTTIEELPPCIDYVTIPSFKEECVGGRGVAPQVCVIKPVNKLFCTRRET